jgi:dihydroflavonol-4-reductase
LSNAGAPIVIVMPGVTYGPNDHSAVGGQLRDAHDGRAPFLALADVGISPAHVDDVAAGIVAALSLGRPGEAYVLAGPNMRLREVMAVAARIAGRTLPRLEIPTRLIRAVAPLGPVLGPLAGQPPNVREILSASDGVTYWASSAKASLKLGYAPRELEGGLRDAFASR